MITEKEIQYIRDNWCGLYIPGWGVGLTVKSPEMLLGECRGMIFEYLVEDGYINKTLDDGKPIVEQRYVHVFVDMANWLFILPPVILTGESLTDRLIRIIDYYLNMKNTKAVEYVQRLNFALNKSFTYNRLYHLDEE